MDTSAWRMEFVLNARSEYAAENTPITASRLLALLPSAWTWTVAFEPGRIVASVEVTSQDDAADVAAALGAVVGEVSLPGWSADRNPPAPPSIAP